MLSASFWLRAVTARRQYKLNYAYEIYLQVLLLYWGLWLDDLELDVTGLDGVELGSAGLDGAGLDSVKLGGTGLDGAGLDGIGLLELLVLLIFAFLKIKNHNE